MVACLIGPDRDLFCGSLVEPRNAVSVVGDFFLAV
jgi:hypothetical protein